MKEANNAIKRNSSAAPGCTRVRGRRTLRLGDGSRLWRHTLSNVILVTIRLCDVVCFTGELRLSQIHRISLCGADGERLAHGLHRDDVPARPLRPAVGGRAAGCCKLLLDGLLADRVCFELRADHVCFELCADDVCFELRADDLCRPHLLLDLVSRPQVPPDDLHVFSERVLPDGVRDRVHECVGSLLRPGGRGAPARLHAAVVRRWRILPPRNGNEVGSRSFEGASDALVDRPSAADTAKRSTARNDAATNANTGRGGQPSRCPSFEDDAEKKAAAKAAGGAAASEKNAPAKKAGGAGPATKKTNTPAAPADGSEPIDLEPAPQAQEGDIIRRESMKALYPTSRVAARRNVLFGTVEDDYRRPREEVPVVVVNRFNSSIRHTGVSDAYGGFAIRVPDGQWIVRVTMPSGNTQPVRDITVSGGRVIDNAEGKDMANLIITY